MTLLCSLAEHLMASSRRHLLSARAFNQLCLTIGDLHFSQTIVYQFCFISGIMTLMHEYTEQEDELEGELLDDEAEEADGVAFGAAAEVAEGMPRTEVTYQVLRDCIFLHIHDFKSDVLGFLHTHAA